MESIIIYDNNGTIFFQASGDIQEPVGLQFIKVTVPTNHTVQRIDVSTEPHAPIFVEIPKSKIEIDVETIQADNEMLKLMVADLGLMVGGGL